MDRNFEHLLDAFLSMESSKEELLDGALGEEPSPDVPKELEELVSISRRFKAIAATLEPTVRRAHLLQITEATSAKRTKKVRWGKRVIRPLIGFAAVLTLLGGTAALAADDLPDEPLYGVKLASERLRLLLETDPAGDAWLRLGFAGSRIEEIERMRTRGRQKGLTRALQNLEGHLAQLGSAAQTEEVRVRHAEVLDGLIEDAGCDEGNPEASDPQCKGLLNARENSTKHQGGPSGASDEDGDNAADEKWNSGENETGPPDSPGKSDEKANQPDESGPPS